MSQAFKQLLSTFHQYGHLHHSALNNFKIEDNEYYSIGKWPELIDILSNNIEQDVQSSYIDITQVFNYIEKNHPDYHSEIQHARIMLPAFDVFFRHFCTYCIHQDLVSQHLSHFKLWLSLRWLFMFNTPSCEQSFLSLINFIAKIVIPIDQYSGKKIDLLFSALNDVFKHHLLPREGADSLNQDFTILQNNYQDYLTSIKPFEEKVQQHEAHIVQVKQLKNESLSLIHSHINEHKLPDWCLTFIMENWAKLFHIHLLRKHPLELAEETLKQLVWSLEIENSEDMQHHLTQEIVTLRNNIRQLFSNIVINENELESFLEALENFHISILENNTLDTSEWIYPEPEEQHFNDDERASLLQSMSVLKTGTWVTYQPSQHQVNCRIIHRDMNSMQLILVNYSGARIDSIHFSTAKKLMSENKLHLLNIQSAIDNVIDKTNEDAVDKIKQFQEIIKKHNSENLKKTVLERITQSKKERIQATKDKQAGERRNVMRAQQEEEKQLFEQQLSFIRKMKPDTLFSWQKEDGSSQFIQFAVRLRQEERMIFVDQHGIKVKVFTPSELAQALINKKVSLVHSNNDFGSTLQQLISERHAKLKT